MQPNETLQQVVTLREAADWFRRPRNAILMRLMAYERMTGRQAFRKSGGVFLIDLLVMFRIFGRPDGDRPDYEGGE